MLFFGQVHTWPGRKRYVFYRCRIAQGCPAKRGVLQILMSLVCVRCNAFAIILMCREVAWASRVRLLCQASAPTGFSWCFFPIPWRWLSLDPAEMEERSSDTEG